MPRPPMGRKTSSAIPPKLTAQSRPLHSTVTGCAVRFYFPQGTSSASSGVFFMHVLLPSFHQPTALCKRIQRITRSIFAFYTICSLALFSAFVKRIKKFFDKNAGGKCRPREFCFLQGTNRVNRLLSCGVVDGQEGCNDCRQKCNADEHHKRENAEDEERRTDHRRDLCV